MKLAQYFYEQIKLVDGFEVGPVPDLSIVIYRYIPKRGNIDEFNQRLMREIQQDGRLFISSTRVKGNLVLRAAILSHRTHLAEIEETLDVLKWKAMQLDQE